DMDTFTGLLNAAPEPDNRIDALATKTASAVAEPLAPALGQPTKALTPKPAEVPPAAPELTPAAPEGDYDKMAADLEARLAKKFEARLASGGDGAALMQMAFDTDDNDPVTVRVKSVVEAYDHTPTALCYRSERSKYVKNGGI